MKSRSTVSASRGDGRTPDETAPMVTLNSNGNSSSSLLLYCWNQGPLPYLLDSAQQLRNVPGQRRTEQNTFSTVWAWKWFSVRRKSSQQAPDNLPPKGRSWSDTEARSVFREADETGRSGTNRQAEQETTGESLEQSNLAESECEHEA